MLALSVIVPFYNSEAKCGRLLSRLQNSDLDDVELILVDDGSDDGTRKVLEIFAASAKIRNKVIFQENKGPGGARNTGLAHAEGLYVWFVDSDDDILIDDAVHRLRDVYNYGYDIVDFNIDDRKKKPNTMELEAGLYRGEEARLHLLKKFGRICTKLFKRDFLISNCVRYPEYCIYEDNPLQFVIPFFAKSLLKCDDVVYIHHEDFASATRGPRSERYFDRLWTATYGYDFARSLVDSGPADLRRTIDSRFVRLYLINTIKLSRFPGPTWIEKARVMRKFRDDAPHLRSSFEWPEFSHKEKAFRFWLTWKMSFLMPSQTKYFERARRRAWGRPFQAPDIPKPKKSQLEQL